MGLLEKQQMLLSFLKNGIQRESSLQPQAPLIFNLPILGAREQTQSFIYAKAVFNRSTLPLPLFKFLKGQQGLCDKTYWGEI